MKHKKNNPKKKKKKTICLKSQNVAGKAKVTDQVRVRIVVRVLS